MNDIMIYKDKKLGEGSSRKVFETEDPHIVAKCARATKVYSVGYRRGAAQNRAEFDIYKYGTLHQFITHLCPVFSISERDDLVLMARAQTITKFKEMTDEFKEKARLFKKKLRFIRKVLSPLQNRRVISISNLIGRNKFTKEELKIVNSKLFKDLCYLMSEYKLMFDDLFKPSSWGYYKGRFVLIDYGYTLAVRDKTYYNR